MRIRTLRGGEGFLSQSSNWIHFGLGGAGEIEKLVVRWPGAAAQEFSGIKSGEFYKLAQGVADAIRFVPPSNRHDLIAAPQVPQALTELARIIVPAGLPARKFDHRPGRAHHP